MSRNINLKSYIRFFKIIGFVTFLLIGVFGIIIYYNYSTLQIAKASEPAWVRQISGTSNNIGTWRTIAIGDNGDVYAGIEYNNGVSFGTTTLNNTGSSLIKYNINGDVIWHKNFSSTSYSPQILAVETDDLGNVYAGGILPPNTDFNGDATLSTTLGYNRLFVIKYSSAGTFQWIETLNNTAFDASDLEDMAVSPSGNVFIIGTTNTGSSCNVDTLSLTNCTQFIAKIDTFGQAQWIKNPGFSNTYSIYNHRNVAADNQGNVYFAGGFTGNGYIAGIPVSSIAPLAPQTQPQSDIYVAKLNANGEAMWVRTGGSPFTDTSSQDPLLETDNQGNVVLGWMPDYENSTTINFAGLTVTRGSGPRHQPLITKLNTAGQGMWSKFIPDSGSYTFYDLAIDDIGNIYTTGIDDSYDNIPIEFGSYFLPGDRCQAIDCILVTKHDKDGGEQWVKINGDYGSPNDYAYAYGIAAGSNSQIAVLGSIYGSTTVDGLTVSSGIGNTDAFVWNLNQPPSSPGLQLTIQQNTDFLVGADKFSQFYQNNDGQTTPSSFKIISNPSSGILLKKNGTTLNMGDIVTAAEFDDFSIQTTAILGLESFQIAFSDGFEYALNSNVYINTVVNYSAPTVSTLNIANVFENEPYTFNNTIFNNGYNSSTNTALYAIKIESLPSSGALSLNGINITVGQEIHASQLNLLTYIPNSNTVGSDSFDWRASDGNQYSIAADSINLQINPGNTRPSVSNFSVTGDKNRALFLSSSSFSANYSDTENDPIAGIKLTALPVNGTLKFNFLPVSLNQEIPFDQLSNLTYFPNFNYIGTDTFDWQASDGQHYSLNTATTTLQVSDAISYLVVNSDTYGPINKNQGYSFTVADFDDNFNAGYFSALQIVTLPANGSLKLNENNIIANQIIPANQLSSITYTPNLNFTGIDTFEWSATEGYEYASPAATASIDVLPFNNPPVVTARSTSTDFETPVPDPGASCDGCGNPFQDGFDAGYSDIDQDPISSVQIVTVPTSGTLKLNGVDVTAGQIITFSDTGSLRYHPNTGFFGTDSFTWKGLDATLVSSNTTTFSIQVDPPVTTPSITGVSITTDEDVVYNFTLTDFQGSYTDQYNPMTSITIVTTPLDGVLRLNGNTISLGAFGANISLNDIDQLSYTPNSNFNPADSFVWRASNIYNDSNDETVTINITPINDKPEINNLQKTTDEDTDMSFDIFSGDFTNQYADPIENDALLAIKITSLPTNGILKLNGTPVTVNQEIEINDTLGLVYTPNLNYFGSDSFGWNARDADYADVPALVEITINGFNDAPVGQDFNKPNIDSISQLNFTLSDFQSNVTDVDHATISSIWIGLPPNDGTLYIDRGATQEAIGGWQVVDAADLNNLYFMPNLTYFGPVSFEWAPRDEFDQAINSSLVNFEVTQNQVPEVQPLTFDIDEGQVVTIQLAEFLAAYTDNENNPITHIRLDNASPGFESRLNGVRIDFLPQEFAIGDIVNIGMAADGINDTGTFTMDWSVSDNGGLSYSNPATLTMNITPINDKPEINNLQKTTDEDTDMSFDIFSGDFTNQYADPIENDALLAIKITSLPTNGILKLNGTPVTVNQEIEINDTLGLVYTPNLNYFGSDSFGWNARDADYADVPALVEITINGFNDAPVTNNFTKPDLINTQITSFTKQDFESNTVDQEDSTLSRFFITNTTIKGQLVVYRGQINEYSILGLQEIPVADLDHLEYVPNPGETGTESFGWYVADSSDENSNESTVQFELISPPVEVAPEQNLASATTNLTSTSVGSNYTPGFANIRDINSNLLATGTCSASITVPNSQTLNGTISNGICTLTGQFTSPSQTGTIEINLSVTTDGVTELRQFSLNVQNPISNCNLNNLNPSGNATSALTIVTTCIAGGNLSIYAADSNKNNDVCTPNNIANTETVDTTIANQSTSSVLCDTIENEITLTPLTVSSNRQNTISTLYDIVFEDLRGLQRTNYTITATLSNFTDGNKVIELGSNPDNTLDDEDPDSVQISGSEGAIFGVLDASMAEITPIRSQTVINNFYSNDSSRYQLGIRTSVINTTTPITLLYTTEPVTPGRFSLDNVLFMLRVPSFIAAGNYQGTIIQTII